VLETRKQKQVLLSARQPAKLMSLYLSHQKKDFKLYLFASRISYKLLYFVFLVVLGFELRISSLLVRDSTS
jgi:hypothetical protein